MGCAASSRQQPVSEPNAWTEREERPLGPPLEARAQSDAASPTLVAPVTSNSTWHAGQESRSPGPLDAGWNEGEPGSYDEMPLPPHSGLPYWEKQALPTLPPGERLTTASGSRRLTTSSGRNKIVVYETKKQKMLKEQAKRRRAGDEAADPHSEQPFASETPRPKTSSRPKTSLPPLAERKRLAEIERSIKELLPEEENVLVLDNSDRVNDAQILSCL